MKLYRPINDQRKACRQPKIFFDLGSPTNLWAAFLASGLRSPGCDSDVLTI
jgi:hypothetical protein